MSKPARPSLVLTDIEGTTTPIAFVHSVLFPYASDAMADFLARRGAEDEVAAILAEVARLVPGVAPLETLLGWMAQDAKITPLKALQGLIWEEGYRSGVLKSLIYPDVAPHLRAWHGAGVALAVYSSGSVAAQRLLFGNTPDGDLTGLFSGFFDTAMGGKREVASYAAIAQRLAREPASILFLSDVGAELDAARGAGLGTCQLLRDGDGAAPAPDHAMARDFAEVAAAVYLPTA